VIPVGPYADIAGATEVRVWGEVRAGTGGSTPTAMPGIQFANVESTPITPPTDVYNGAVWAPPAFIPPDTTTPWVDITTIAGKYLLARPVFTVHSGTNNTLQAVALRATFEIRFC
jgi:hypothetical protein